MVSTGLTSTFILACQSTWVPLTSSNRWKGSCSHYGMWHLRALGLLIHLGFSTWAGHSHSLKGNFLCHTLGTHPSSWLSILKFTPGFTGRRIITALMSKQSTNVAHLLMVRDKFSPRHTDNLWKAKYSLWHSWHRLLLAIKSCFILFEGSSIIFRWATE